MQLTIGLIAIHYQIKAKRLHNIVAGLRRQGREFGTLMSETRYSYSETEAAELVELSGRSRGWQRGKSKKPVTPAGVAKE